MSQYILIIGANSDIAQALAKIYAKEGYNLYLASRDEQSLQSLASDLSVRYTITVLVKKFDLLQWHTHTDFFNSLEPKPEGVVLAGGYLGTQNKAEKDFSETKKIIDTNFTGPVSILNIISDYYEQKKSGFIIGISSVAGDRGRKSNYIYGAAKAGFSTYLSGLRNRLSKANVHVLTVKPGFVDTKMTKHIDLPKKLTAQPKDVAMDIYKAQLKKKNVLYTKPIWQFIMFVIKLIPEWQFKKMSI